MTTRTRPSTIHADRAAVLDRLLARVRTIASEVETDLRPLYADGDTLAPDQIAHLVDVLVPSLVNCVEVEKVLQHGLATRREGR